MANTRWRRIGRLIDSEIEKNIMDISSYRPGCGQTKMGYSPALEYYGKIIYSQSKRSLKSEFKLLKRLPLQDQIRPGDIGTVYNLYDYFEDRSLVWR